MKIVVRNKQTILDLAIQLYGDATAASQLAIDNNVTITAMIQPGTELNANSLVYNDALRDYYAARGIAPATWYDVPVPPIPPGPSFLPETEALWARLSVDPGLEWKILYDELIGKLIDCGVWSISDVIRFSMAPTSELGLINLVKSDHAATAVNSPMFVAKKGFDSDGLAYIEENYTPSTHAVNLASDSQSYYVVGDFAAAVNSYAFGTYYISSGSRYCMFSRTPAAYSPWGVDFYQIRPAGYDNYILCFETATENVSIAMISRVGGADAYINATLAGSAAFSPSLPNEELWSLGTHYYSPAASGVCQKILIISSELTTAQLIALDSIRDWWIEKMTA